MRTQYARVADDLRRLIRGGGFDDRPLPSMPELGRQYGVHWLTARRAVTELASEGLVVSDGRRWRVREHQPLTVHITRAESRVWEGQRPTAGADSWEADMVAAGRVPQKRLTVRVEAASAAVAWRLRELEGADVVVRELLRLADGEPHNLVRFAFPMAVAAGTRLMRSADIPEGTIAAYLAELGHEPVRFMVEIEPRMPSQHETAVLAVPPGVPVARVYRTGLDAAECPVYAEEAVWPGDRALLALEVE